MPSILFINLTRTGFSQVITALPRRQPAKLIFNNTEMDPICQAAKIPYANFYDYMDDDVKKTITDNSRRYAIRLNRAFSEPALGSTFPQVTYTPLKDHLKSQINTCINDQIIHLSVLKNIIHQEDLRLIVLTTDNNHITRAIVEYARKNSIPTLLIEHAVLGHRHSNIDRFAIQLYADYVCAYGDFSKASYCRQGVPAERIFVTGSPRWDPYATDIDPDQKDTIRQKLNLDPTKKIVTYGHPWIGEGPDYAHIVRQYSKDLQTILHIARRLPHIQLVIKLHPNDFANLPPEFLTGYQRAFSEVVVQAGMSGRVAVGNFNTREILSITDLLVSFYASNLVIEGILAHTPALVVAHIQQPLYFTYDDPVLVLHHVLRERSISERELERAITILLSQDTPTGTKIIPTDKGTFQRAQAKFNFRNDGHAAERVAEVIFRLASDPAAFRRHNPSQSIQ